MEINLARGIKRKLSGRRAGLVVSMQKEECCKKSSKTRSLTK